MQNLILLHRLSPGVPVTVGDLANDMGVSIEKVKTATRRLIEIGLPITQPDNYSVMLTTAITPLDSYQICQAVTTFDSVLAGRITVFDEVDSTNQYLMDLPQTQLQHKQVCLAECMTAGRGRQDRKWHGGAYQNVLLSLAWQVNRDVNRLAGLSLAIAVMIIDCLVSICDAPFKVKWPNDVLVYNRKLSGILIEIKDDFAIIGIGINCDLSTAQEATIDQPVTSLAQIMGQTVDRNILIPQLLASLARGLEEFTVAGLESFRDAWTSLHAHQGKLIRVAGPPIQTGTVQGIDHRGALVIKSFNGDVMTIYSGDLSVITQ